MQQSAVGKIILRIGESSSILVVMPMVPMGYTGSIAGGRGNNAGGEMVPLLGDHKIMQMVMAVLSLVA